MPVPPRLFSRVTKTLFLPAFLLAMFVLNADAQFNTYPFPTEAKTLGSAGTPGDLDKEFSSLLGGTHNVQFLDNPPDMRTAMVQTDGKILIGGTFRLRASNVTYVYGDNQTTTANVIWRNLARLNADGTLDTTFLSPQALEVAVTTRNPNIVYGPDGAVYSILVESNDDLYQYLVAGDFLNFSHNQLGNPAPRKRYLTIETFDPNPNIVPAPGLPRITVANAAERVNLRTSTTTTLPGNNFFPGLPTGTLVTQNFVPIGTIVFQSDNGLTYRKVTATGTPSASDWVVVPKPSEALVSLTFNVADGDGFNGPVRKIRRLFGTVVSPDILVRDTPSRLALLVPIGTRVLQTDNGFIYEKISGAANLPTDPVDWVILPGGRQILYFATGDFTSFVNDPDARYITRFVLNPGGITLPSRFSEWTTTPQPDKRVWDVTALGSQIFFVGDFDTIGGGQLNWRKIAVISQNGTIDPGFDPGAGFNDSAMSIVADPIQNNVVVAGYFTNYDGNTLGRIARVNTDGSMVAGFPAANNGNSEGANGPIRCVTRQPDGRLIIAGEFTSYNGIKRAGVARLEADGSLDETFVPQGRASGIQNFAFDIDGGPATASLFARPIAVGNFSNLFGSGFTGVARFIGGSFPVIWYQPNQLNAPYAVLLGDNKRLSVVATDNYVGKGTPPFEPIQVPSEPLLYQWQKNGRNIQGEVLPYLDIEGFEPADAGKYRVLVWNSHFLVQSESVTLAWISFPGIPANGLRVQGLIEPNSTLNGDLGGSIVFNMSRTGMVTGTLTLGNLDGRPYVARFRGQYNYKTGLTVQIRRPNQSPLTLRLKTEFPPPEDFPFDFSGPDNSLSDSFGNVAAISAAHIPWSRSEPASAYAGTYNIGLETDPAALSEMMDPAQPEELQQPMVSQGFGFLTMRIAPANGQTRISGLLADGTKFTTTSSVRKDTDGSVSVWIPLYKSQGTLAGTFSILSDADADNILPPEAANPVLAELRWSKPSGVAKSPDAGGFLNIGVNAANGSGLFNPSVIPASFALALEFGDGAWAGRYGSLSDGPFFQDFLVNGGRAVPEGDNPQSVTLGLSTRNGLLQGKFIDRGPGTPPRTVSYKALTLTASGFPEFYGFFLMPNTARNPDFWVGGSVFGSGF